MRVTARQVGRTLGLGRETTARVLAAGLAGPRTSTAGATWYDAELVAGLAGRPVVGADQVRRTCPNGLLAGRVDPRRDGPAGPWRASVIITAAVSLLVDHDGRVPLVVTVGGFVLSTHDVIGAAWRSAPHDERPGRWLSLRLAPPGPWSEVFAGAVLRTPPGHPLLAWQCPLLPNHRRIRPR